MFKSDNNFFKAKNVPLIAYQPVLIIIYEFHVVDNLNLFINNIENIFKGKIVI